MRHPPWGDTRGLDAETVVLISRGLPPDIWKDYPENDKSMCDFDMFILECVLAFQIIHQDAHWSASCDYWDSVDEFCEAVKQLCPTGLIDQPAKEIARQVSEQLASKSVAHA